MANTRKANVAEGVAIQMLRPFAAIAPVPREEDHGIDVVATLLHRDGKVLIAGSSFFVQIKTHTAAAFEFRGDGLEWLRRLQLPYIPLVVNLDTATADLYTLPPHHQPIFLGALDEMVFVPNDASNGFNDFPLGDPLMSWSLADCADRDFPMWAHSVLQPALQIETRAFQNGKISSFLKMEGNSYSFRNRDQNGIASEPPKIGEAWNYVPRNPKIMLDTLRDALGPLAYTISNTPGLEDKGDDLLHLRELLRGLGIDPDPENDWDQIVEEMGEYL